MKDSTCKNIEQCNINGIKTKPFGWKETAIRYEIDVLTDYTANGSFADLKKNVTYSNTPDYARVIRLTDLRTDLSEEGVYVTEDAYNFLKKSSLVGDEFLLANVGAYAGLSVRMPTIDYPATLGPNMYLVKFNQRKVDKNYIFYYAKSKHFYEQLQLIANSSPAQPKINKDDFKSVKLLIAPKNEQVKIADFLDIKVERIRTQIKKIKKMIGLLKEKKEIIIISAVTKGINPDVPIKDSNIDWIGKIPKHWKKSKIKYYAPFFTGWTPPSKLDEYYKGDVPWANISDLGEKYITETENHISEEAVEDFKMIPSPKGSILFSFKLSIGQTSFAGIDLYTNEAIATFDKININRKYFYYMASVFICKNANENIYGAPILNQYLIKNANIVISDSEIEQQQIAEFLDVETSKIERAIKLNSNLIKKLIEYQEALITAAVTGKIEVRGE